MAADFIAFTAGENYLLPSGLPATCYFLLSSKPTSGIGSLALTDTLSGGVGEITGTGYARQSQPVPTPSAGAVAFAMMSWATATAVNWPNNVVSCVLATTSNNTGVAVCAWNLTAGGAARDMSHPNLIVQFTPTLATSS